MMNMIVSFIPGVAGAVVAFVVTQLLGGLGFHFVLTFLIFLVIYLVIAVGMERAMKAK